MTPRDRRLDAHYQHRAEQWLWRAWAVSLTRREQQQWLRAVLSPPAAPTQNAQEPGK